MASNIKINLLRNKPKYTSNLGENNYRVYTPGEAITEQKDFMRLENELKDCSFKIYCLTSSLEVMERTLKTETSSHRLWVLSNRSTNLSR